MRSTCTAERVDDGCRVVRCYHSCDPHRPRAAGTLPEVCRAAPGQLHFVVQADTHAQAKEAMHSAAEVRAIKTETRLSVDDQGKHLRPRATSASGLQVEDPGHAGLRGARDGELGCARWVGRDLRPATGEGATHALVHTPWRSGASGRGGRKTRFLNALLSLPASPRRLSAPWGRA